jgi:hypothetical protein
MADCAVGDGWASGCKRREHFDYDQDSDMVESIDASPADRDLVRTVKRLRFGGGRGGGAGAHSTP